jgi:hypothetical protein
MRKIGKSLKLKIVKENINQFYKFKTNKRKFPDRDLDDILTCNSYFDH